MRNHSILGFVLLASSAIAQELNVPDETNGYSPGGTTALWRTTAGVVQFVYDTSHFTNAGVTGPITISRIKLRHASGINYAGAHTFPAGALAIRLGDAALDWNALSTTYASNRSANLGALGVLNGGAAVVLPNATGAWVNEVCLDIDLTACVPPATFVYDPTLGADLLVEFINTAGIAPTTNLPNLATAGATAIRARRCAGTTAGPGALSTFAAHMEFSFAGSGGFAAPVGGVAQNIGAPCGAQAQSFYQYFNFVSDTFDLANKSLTLTPDNGAAPNYYIVTSGTTAPDLSATALGGAPDSTADDAVVNEVPGFTFNFPGGSTTTLGADTNGSVWLAAGALTDFTPTVLEFRNQLPRFCPYWLDNNCATNVATVPGSGLYVNTDLSGGPGNGVTYVTWKETAQYNGFGSAIANTTVCKNTYQVVIFENGTVEFRYGTMEGADAFVYPLVGFSRGGTVATPCVDPGSRNLSHEVPFSTSLEGTNGGMTLTAATRPILSTTGTPISTVHTLVNIPVTTLISVVVIDFGGFQPGVPLFIGNAGCIQTVVSPNIMTAQFNNNPTLTTTPFAFPLGIGPTAGGWMGVPLYTQGVTLDSTNSTYSSNAMRLVMGLF
jgi:hypothetical protein